MAPSFYLGPLGALVPLESPASVDNTLVKTAGIHTTLSGARTEDVQGYRRDWKIDFEYLYPEDLGYLEACFLQAVPGPLRLIDPLRKNRLSPAASIGGRVQSWSGATEAWKTLAPEGTVTNETQAGGWPQISYTSASGRPLQYRGYRARSWQVSAAGQQLTADANCPVPALPGEALTFSAYVKTSAPSVLVGLLPQDESGTYLTEVTGGASTSADWTRITVSYTVPASGVSAVVPFIEADDLGTVTTAAWQVEAGTEATTWVPGTGCPIVLISELPTESPFYPFVNPSMTLLER